MMSAYTIKRLFRPESRIAMRIFWCLGCVILLLIHFLPGVVIFKAEESDKTVKPGMLSFFFKNQVKYLPEILRSSAKCIFIRKPIKLCET